MWLGEGRARNKHTYSHSGTGMNYLHFEAPIPVIHRDLKSRNGEILLKLFINYFIIFYTVVIAQDLTAKVCDMMN